MNKIKDLREAREWSMATLAERIEPPTTATQINKLEKEQRKLSPDWLRRISDAFGCRMFDLIDDGQERVRMVPVVGYVGAGEEVMFFDDHAEGAGLDEIEAPPGEPGAVAVLVKGTSMIPRYLDGDYIFFSREAGLDPARCLHRDCVIRLPSGGTLLKRLEAGSNPDHFTLKSYNLAVPLITDVTLEWVAPVTWVKPK